MTVVEPAHGRHQADGVRDARERRAKLGARAQDSGHRCARDMRTRIGRGLEVAVERDGHRVGGTGAVQGTLAKGVGQHRLVHPGGLLDPRELARDHVRGVRPCGLRESSRRCA